MIKSAIEYVLGLKRPEIIEVDGFTHSIGGYNRFTPPAVSSDTVHTLRGVVDMIEHHKGTDQFPEPMVHVLGPDSVYVQSPILAKHRTREHLCEAKLTGDVFPFGRFMDIEEFIIGIQALFVQDDNIKMVMAKIGTITQDAKVQTLDDGTSQVTTIRKGVAGVENIVIPNPISLRPYRTFREVEQPASNFVLRIKEGNRVALFEADGGAWKIEAIKNVAEWLSNATERQYPVIA